MTEAQLPCSAGSATFNLNHNVRVKLTDVGRAAILKNHKNLFGDRADKFAPRKVIEVEGWSEWQLWELMAEFGPYLSNGRPVPFETEIQMPVPAQGSVDTLLLLQARYVLKNLNVERPGCGYDKLADACGAAAQPPAQVAQAGKVTDAMIEAAVEAAWPGPEIVYDDNFGSAEAMMKAALEAALAAQPPAAPVETTRLDVAKAIDPGAAWGMAVERDSPANERILQALAKADAALAVSRSSTGAAANRHLIDFISEKIGLPHNEEPSCDNFLAWFVAGEPQKARLFLKISSAIYQLNRAEQSTTDEVVRRHLREIITWLKEE